jgi:hypothetical protein
VGIFDRLGDMLRSYLNDEDGGIFGRPRREDPDMEEAEAELESFLQGAGPWAETEGRDAGRRRSAGDWGKGQAGDRGGTWDRGRAGGPRAETGDWTDSRDRPAGGWDGRRAGDRGGQDNGGGGTWGGNWTGGRGDRTGGGAWDWTSSRTGGWNEARRREPAGPPETLRPDFEELGIPFGAGAEDCKAAYRRLLKLHHPDRHAGHQGNMEKATKKMAKINAAYDRIERWRAGKD